MDVNSVVLTPLFELGEEASSEDKSDEWIHNFFGLVDDFDI